MKPLELTVYPPIKYPTTGAEIEQWRFERQVEIQLRKDKRLTDAELAAEVWSAVEARTRHAGNILGGQHDNPYAQAAFNRAIQRVQVMYRFATLPHYDEADQ